MEKIMQVSVNIPADVIVDAILEKIAKAPHRGVSTAIGDIPKLGEAWLEQGGVRAAECRGDDGRIYDLVVVTGADGKPVIFKDREWGCYGIEIKGAASLRDGLANTKAMADAGSALAKDVMGISTQAAQDCYLPALCELNQVFANVGHLFETDVYWSSTQYSANYAWGQDFVSGDTGLWSKGSHFRALVVRRVYR